MKRPAVCLSAWLSACLAVAVLVGWPGQVHAQRRRNRPAPAPAPAAEPEKPAEATPPPAEPDKPAADAPKEEAPPPAAAAEDLRVPEGEATATPVPTGQASPTLSWQDIVVVPRKSFLKSLRLELAPFAGLSVNDLLIRHYVFGVDLNFFLTDVLWIGLQGQYFLKSLTEREELVGLQYDRIPSLNRYLYGGSFNLGYVPAYGKFSLFNRSIFHWEIYATAGVGVTKTEIIPRDPANDSFTNIALTPNVGIGTRLFLFNWLTLNISIRDYILPDKYENQNRPSSGAADAQNGATAKANATQALVNNVMVMAGIGIYLPTKFQYKTPR